MKTLVLVLFLAMATGCGLTRPTLCVKGPGLDARGPSTSAADKVRMIHLLPSNLPPHQAHQLWVSFDGQERLLLGELTETSMAERRANKQDYVGSESSAYTLGGVRLVFRAGELQSITLGAWPKPGSADLENPILGMADKSLVLPCLLDEFKAVFGEDVEVRRQWGGW